MNYEEFKKEILRRSKEAHACTGEYKRAYNAESIEGLIEVIKDNLGFAVSKNILTKELVERYEKPELFGIGNGNAGFFNSGDRNSGNWNSGNRNSGNWNSGNRNSGNRNSGDWNSGDWNSGNWNSGNRNSGNWNSGDRNSGNRNSGNRNSGDRNSGNWNSGDLNSGYRNSGDLNSGYRNSGDRNSGDLNSGYRNSGVFCNRKREDKVIIFNKESDMTWDDWFDSRAYDLSRWLKITEWIDWYDMTDEEKKDKPKAFVTDGYVKVYSYKEAWANLWATFDDDDKAAFTSLPNFDKDVFEDITGINIDEDGKADV